MKTASQTVETPAAVPVYKDRIVWDMLIIVMVLTGLVRYHLMDVPLERDEGEYAYAGQLIMKGVSPCQEVHSMKLPGIYAAYALIISIFGQTHQGVHAGLLAVNEITIVLVFLLARCFVRSPAAVVSAAAFAVFSMSQSVQGIYANAEHFVILFSIAGLLLMLRALEKKNNFKLFIAGLFLGLGFMMKQHGLMFCIMALLYIILDRLLQKPLSWRSMAVNLLAAFAGLAAIVGLLLLLIAWTGGFEKFWFWTFDYAKTYVSQKSFVNMRHELLENSANIIRSAPLLWIIAGLGLLVLPAGDIHRSRKIFLLLFTLFSFLSICPGFYFREHYFIMLLPCAGVLSAVAVSVLYKLLSRFLPAVLSYSVPVLLVAAAVGQSVYRQRDYLFYMTHFEISRSIYGLYNPFPESLPVASFIRDHTAPDDTIAVLGSEPQIFFYSQRRSASGHIYMYPLMERHEYALQMQKEFIGEIEAKKPKYLIYVDTPTSWLQTEGSHQHIYEWMLPYLQTQCRLVGSVYLCEGRSEYRWGPQEWPALTLFSILILERQN